MDCKYNGRKRGEQDKNGNGENLDGFDLQEFCGVLFEVKGDASTTTKSVSVGILYDCEGSISLGGPDVSVSDIRILKGEKRG